MCNTHEHSGCTELEQDCGQGGWLGEEGGGNSWCDPFKSWQRMYSCVISCEIDLADRVRGRFDPYKDVTEDQKKLVLGG